MLLLGPTVADPRLAVAGPPFILVSWDQGARWALPAALNYNLTDKKGVSFNTTVAVLWRSTQINTNRQHENLYLDIGDVDLKKSRAVCHTVCACVRACYV